MPAITHKLSDSEVMNYIEGVTTKRTKRISNALTADEISSIGFNAAQLADCIKYIINGPSKQDIENFKAVTLEKRTLHLLNSTEVSFGLDIKNEYDLGRLYCFDRILKSYGHYSFELAEDPIIAQFIKEMEYFLLPLPPIDDEGLKQQLETKSGLGNLSTLGECYYKDTVSSYLLQRFPDEDIREISRYACCYKVFARWARLYNLIEDDKAPAHEVFLAYIGALASKITYDETAAFEIERFIYVLIEPLLMQFDKPVPLNTYPKEDLNYNLQGRFFFETYASTHERPLYMVQIYVTPKLLIATATSHTLELAEDKAASIALSNSDQLSRAKDYGAVFASRSSPHGSPYFGQARTALASATGPAPVSHPIPLSGSTLPGQCPSYSQSTATEYATPQPSAPKPNTGQSYGGDSYDTTLVHQPQAQTAIYPQGFINPQYQRQLQMEAEDIIEVPIITDESQVDMSSKSRLNEHFTKNRLPTAEYRTDKLNNSDVQVTCSIDNIPIVKAIFQNKKKAGQICAQYILNNWTLVFNRYLEKKEMQEARRRM